MMPLGLRDDDVEEEVAEAPDPCAHPAGVIGGLLPLPPVCAALHYSFSSTALAPLEEAQADPETPPNEQLSPAIQASMAAWQSATALLQELAGFDGGFALPPPLCPLPGSPPLSAHQQQWLLQTPDQQPEGKAGSAGNAAAVHSGMLPQHPAWLAALVSAQQEQRAPPQEASSPQRFAGQP